MYKKKFVSTLTIILNIKKPLKLSLILFSFLYSQKFYYLSCLSHKLAIINWHGHCTVIVFVWDFVGKCVCGGGGEYKRNTAFHNCLLKSPELNWIKNTPSKVNAYKYPTCKFPPEKTDHFWNCQSAWSLQLQYRDGSQSAFHT